ncbi:MAG: ribbon-helix-helix domain-containing protein [Hyphomicrobiaceae bacterium]
MFSGQSPQLYESHTRSLRLGGHATSIRLEAAFWMTLEEIAATQGVSLPRFLTKLHDEVLDFHGEINNFTSLLRCACLTYAAEVKGRDQAEVSLKSEARTAFSGTISTLGTPPLHRQDL